MADTAGDIRANLERQIADLKHEMGRMGKMIRARAGDAADSAGEVYDDARGRATLVARQVRDQAQLVGGAARENPGTAATVVTTVGVLGFMAGMMVGGFFSRDR